MNFLDNPDLQKKIKEKVEAAKQGIAKLAERGKHARGCSYFFQESNHLPVRWVAVVQHVDNPFLWYLVAADEYHDIGTCDIELPPNHPWSPMALRCNVGFWAHESDLTLKNYAGRLEGEIVDDAQLRLSEMVQGAVPTYPSGLAVDEDPEYCKWMQELLSKSLSIEKRIQSANDEHQPIEADE